MESFGLLLLGLLFITLVGHGLWVLGAKIIKTVTFREPTPPKAISRSSRKECPFCFHIMNAGSDICPGCGETKKVAQQLADLRITLAQLREFQADGLLRVGDFQKLSGLSHLKRRQL